LAAPTFRIFHEELRITSNFVLMIGDDQG
jgi:hypothetical protein